MVGRAFKFWVRISLFGRGFSMLKTNCALPASSFKPNLICGGLALALSFEEARALARGCIAQKVLAARQTAYVELLGLRSC